MKDLIFKNWGWFRAARLLFATFMLYKGYTSGDIIYYIIGGLLAYQAVFNIKCLAGTVLMTHVLFQRIKQKILLNKKTIIKLLGAWLCFRLRLLAFYRL